MKRTPLKRTAMKRTRKKTRKKSKELILYWELLADHGCVISGRTPQLHHCFSGSMRSKGVQKGASQKVSDWLVIPLAEEFHTGSRGIHSIGVETWEKRYGKQSSFIDEMIALYGFDVWELWKNE